MPKAVTPGIPATLTAKPEGSPVSCPVGMRGMLEIWESERKWPGKKGAVFYWPIEEGEDGEASTSKYFKTSFSYDLDISGDVISFERIDESGVVRAYEFATEKEAAGLLS